MHAGVTVLTYVYPQYVLSKNKKQYSEKLNILNFVSRKNLYIMHGRFRNAENCRPTDGIPKFQVVFKEYDDYKITERNSNRLICVPL